MALARKLTSKIYEVQAHSQKVQCLDLGETGRVMVTGGFDRNVNLWAFGNDKCCNSLAGHNGPIECVKFAYHDNLVYSADANGIIKRWDLNGSSGLCTTFYGHMKSVRTLDFHPYGEYVASGSNDTTVRLWDVRKDNKCIESYRGHIANVNSVKFSPDGSWIASAGTEGCLIVWDIRMRKKIIEFQEHASPITCIQFHPFEFLIAAGRNDGTVDLYDLESRNLISRTNGNSPFGGHTVKCISFSEDGKCLFVGTAAGVSVIGWEPDREFDHIESEWSILGDMKVLNKKLFCASFEGQTVKIHDIQVDKVFPFYNPNNQPFSHNQSVRKSFSRTNSASKQLRLKIKSNGTKKLYALSDTVLTTQSPGNGSAPLSRTDDELSSPSSLSFEMIEEEPAVTLRNGFNFDEYARKRSSDLFSPAHSTDPYMETPPSSMPTDESTNVVHDQTAAEHYIENYTSDLDLYPMHSSPGSQRVVEPERDDFPINNATPPDYAPKIDIALHLSKTSLKHKQQSGGIAHSSSANTVLRRQSPPNLRTSGGGGSLSSRLAQRKYSLTSLSTIDLHRATNDEPLSAPISSGYGPKKGTTASGVTRSRSPVRNYISSYATTNNNGHSLHNAHTNHQNNNNNNNQPTVKYRRNEPASTHHQNRENVARKKIPVQIFETPNRGPQRSRTSLDLRGGNARSSAPTSPTNKRKTILFNQAPSNHAPHQPMMSESDDNALTTLTAQHETVIEHLNHRYTTLQILRNFTKSEDVVGTLKQAIKMNDPPLMVDLFGIVLETSSVPWSLDLCILLLPEIFELLRNNNRFHITRGCDLMRLILTLYLPIIQENSDPYGAPRSLGVDVTAEERREKCKECRKWLLRIKELPEHESVHAMGKTGLTEVQNLIVDL